MLNIMTCSNIFHIPFFPLTLYDLKKNFCLHAFNFGATLLFVGDFSLINSFASCVKNNKF